MVPVKLLLNSLRDNIFVFSTRLEGMEPVYDDTVRDSSVIDDRPPREEGTVPYSLLVLASMYTTFDN